MPPRVAVTLSVALVIITWAVRLYLGQEWICHDDLARLVFSNDWRQGFWWFTPDAYWLPLPIWWNGLLLGETIHHHSWAQTSPSLIAIGVAIWMGGMSRFIGALPILALMTVPLTFAFTTSILSEPLFILAGISIIHCFLLAWRKGEGSWCLAVGVLLAALCLIRYESWMTSGILILVLLGRLWRLHGIRGCKVAALAATPAVLAIAGWLWLNHEVHGNWRHPFQQSAEQAIRLSNRDLVMYAVRSMLLQGPIVVILAAIGLWRFHKSPEAAILAAFSLPFVYMLISNRVGSSLPERFAFSVFVGALPLLGRLAAGFAVPLQTRMIFVGGLLAVSAAVWSLIHFGSIVQPAVKDDARLVGNIVREGRTKGIIFDYETPPAPKIADLPVYRAFMPRGSLICSDWIADRFPLDDADLKELRVSVLLYKNPESVETLVRMGEGVRVLSENRLMLEISDSGDKK